MSEELGKLTNGVKLVGETVLPGASQLMDGNVVSGAGHAVVGLAARALIGPIGWGLVAANSFSKSVTGDGLLGLISSKKTTEVTPAETSA